jgi:hypothetical protein
LKNEPLCKGYRRLHVLISENLCAQKAGFLKIGSCALVVALADAGLNPGQGVQLANPLGALRTVAADVTCKKQLELADGKWMTAVQIQRHYLDLAEAYIDAKFMPDWAPEVCALWRETLDKLESTTDSIADSLDWGIKLALYANHARSLGIRWDELDCMNQVIDRADAALEALRDSGKAMSVERAIGLKRAMPEEVRSLEPVLRSRGLQWDDVRTLLNHRQSFLELDWRFGQLGPNGIFQMLDEAGVLNHRISGMDNIEQAITEAPGNGRAHVRGKVIQRLAGTGNLQCDWQSIIDFDKGQVLDLSDPFMSEEGTWNQLESTEIHNGRVFHRLSEVFDFEPNPGEPGRRSPYSRRQDAADRILSGDFAGAETLLHGLLEERFNLPSTHCHMARVLLMTDREPGAREHINMAWTIREQADRYVVARILFFKCVFAMFDGADLAAIIAQLKPIVSEPSAHLEWTIMPMLDHLRPRLGEANFEFLVVLAEVLSDSDPVSRLEDYLQWQSAVTQ